MNKTKIGEKFLLPRRNFEVSDGKEITFGATKAQYMIVVDEKVNFILILWFWINSIQWNSS